MVGNRHLTQVIALLVDELLFEASECWVLSRFWSSRADIRAMLILFREDEHGVIDFVAG